MKTYISRDVAEGRKPYTGWETVTVSLSERGLLVEFPVDAMGGASPDLRLMSQSELDSRFVPYDPSIDYANLYTWPVCPGCGQSARITGTYDAYSPPAKAFKTHTHPDGGTCSGSGWVIA